MQQKKKHETAQVQGTGSVMVGYGTENVNDAGKKLPEELELNLSDFALFLSVMKVKEAYTDVLSIILDEPDLKLKEVKVEEVILNRSGKRAIRLDAWAQDIYDRQFDMEMQNDTSGDDVRRRSRFYQSLIDTPILKSGKKTRYKHLPSTVIIFITQEDIFRRDRVMYTFREQCEEEADLLLKDGATKIFLNMTSRNGRQELVSMLQYMKHTTLTNPDIAVMDERILDLDRVVEEVKKSEEWEVVKMGILEIGLERGMQRGMELGIEKGIEKGMAQGRELGMAQGIEQGIEQGSRQTLVRNVDLAIRNFGLSLQEVCDGLGVTVEEYKDAKSKLALSNLPPDPI